ncbi:MAG: rhomboid family intramembrane serine protease [Anaerolineaceae bacterium]|nr:rhomboid family intramembrane serine protease [Anaerolineaceae bacterium]
MFPIRDTIRSHSFPIITLLIIAANAVVFFFELTLSPAALERFFFIFGIVPARLNPANPISFYPFLTSMFLHGGWLHFIGNMWFLFIFGDNVEDRLGSGKYLIFYLFGGIVAGGLQALFTLGSSIPSIGASGAIAAVLGAYLLYFPRSRVITFIPLFFLPWFVEISAIFYLVFWFVMQLFSGVLSLAGTADVQTGGVAFWAHVGGFLFGMMVAFPSLFRRPRGRAHPDEYYPW